MNQGLRTSYQYRNMSAIEWKSESITSHCVSPDHHVNIETALQSMARLTITIRSSHSKEGDAEHLRACGCQQDQDGWSKQDE